MRKKIEKKVAALAMLLTVSLALTACGTKSATPEEPQTEEASEEVWEETESEEAKNMLLNKKEGTLGIIEGGSALAEENIYEGMKLISGDQLNTEEESYAWIDLDDTKELKMDQNSETKLSKEGKNLAITLTKGNLFFHVAEHLSEDESLEIDTTTMNMAIRGTTGIVEQVSDYETAILLLEGSLEIDASYEPLFLQAGQLAHLVANENGYVSYYVRNIYQEDIPKFAAEQIGGRGDIQDKIKANGGNPSPAENPYLPYIRDMIENGKLPNGKNVGEMDGKGGGVRSYLAVGDIDGDGNDKFLLRWGEDYGSVECEAVYAYDEAKGSLREELLLENAGSTQYYKNGTAVTSSTDYTEYIWEYDSESGKYQKIATIKGSSGNDGMMSYTVDSDTLGCHGEKMSHDEYQEFLSANVTKQSGLAECEKMPVTENTLDRFCNLADYAAKYVLKDGTYVNKGLSLKDYFPEGHLTYTCSWEYTSEDGNKENFLVRECKFPIDENTNYVVDGRNLGNDLDAFKWDSPDYWDADHMTITVKDGVCTEVSIRW